MKTCLFCAEEIQDSAIKCKHCGEFQDVSQHRTDSAAQEKIPWYFRKSFILIAVLSIGPIALPLIWWHPHMTKPWKTGLTIAIGILSWFIFQASMESIHLLKEYYKLIKSL